MIPAELARLPEHFSNSVAGSPQFDDLLQQCALNGLWLPAAALARRLLSAQPHRDDIRAILEDAEFQLARSGKLGDVGCACGSGRIFAQCHGSADAPPPDQPLLKRFTPDEFVDRGTREHRRGDLTSAGREYRAALALNRDHPAALHNLGLVRLQAGRVEEALALIERTTVLLPDQVEVQHSFAQALVANGRIDEAVPLYRYVITQNPSHYIAWYNFGLAAEALNNYAQAAAAFGEAVRIHPGFSEAHARLVSVVRAVAK
jgi:tetratricopeptide (TPR) repeat protein